VVITGTVDAEDEDDNTVNTGYGKQKKDGVGYATQSIKDDDISEINTTVSDAISGKFTGLNKGREDDISQSIIRGYSSLKFNNFPLIVLDGVPLPRSLSSQNDEVSEEVTNFGTPLTRPNSSQNSVSVQVTDFIDPNNIADITVLKGLAATNRYGSEGSNGVILITSKSFEDLSPRGGAKGNSARIKDNIYTGNTVKRKSVLITPYINELRNAGDTQNTYKAYLLQKDRYTNDPFYYTDVFDFFMDKDLEIAYRILSNIVEDSESSIETLRGMMFKAVNNNQRNLALRVADIILERFPGLTQSYFDIALAHKNKGNYQIALNMLMGVEDGSINPELDFSGLKKCANNEIRNLVTRYRGRLNTTNLPARYNAKVSLDARLVFDWNNPDAEFEIQFVNPTKRFFKWLHTSENQNEINDELKNGYSQEEFEIVGGDKGLWIINVKYLGNRTKGNTTPTYLKCTVQNNFGKPNQKDEEHLIRLSKKGQEQLFLKIVTR
jgi:TonB-dependent SusC/RagA subfamily outer membrane receptor